MRTFDELESPNRRKLHIGIGIGVVGLIYLIIVAVIRVFLI